MAWSPSSDAIVNHSCMTSNRGGLALVVNERKEVLSLANKLLIDSMVAVELPLGEYKYTIK
jgi:hypothetical protein